MLTRAHALSVSWAELARDQGGVVSRAQLRELGRSRSSIDHLLASGALTRFSAGVYLVRGAPVTYTARLWAATLATTGVLGFDAAAHLWGVLDTEPPVIDVIIEPQRRASASFGVRVNRIFTPSRWVQRRHGLRLITRTQTVLDLLGRLAESDAQRLADRALQRGWITTGDMESRLTEFPGRRGNARLRQIARACGDGAAAESERRLHAILRRARIGGWLPNFPLWVDGQLVAVLDVAFIDRRVALEVDGWAFHSDVDRFQRDRQRQNALVALGWTVLRFTWADLTQRPGYVARAVRAAL
jgi:very-short-patch-repair endonuclease